MEKIKVPIKKMYLKGKGLVRGLDRMEHYIITRFSIRTLGGFHGDVTRLFDEHRLETRFLMFRTFCLPSIIGQTSKNFDWIILVDPLLPKRYLKRLNSLIKKHQHIHIVSYHPDMNLGGIDFIEKNVKKIKSKYVITTRLDDDDAICSDFVGRIQRDYQKLKNKDLLFISYPKGLHWRPDKRAKYGVFSETYYECIALGLSLVAVKDKYPFTVYGWNHIKIIPLLKESQKDPKSELYQLAKAAGDAIENWDIKKKLKIINTKDNVYIRTIHGENDAAKLASKRFFKNIKLDVDLSKFSLIPKKIQHANRILASQYLNEVSY